LTPKGRQRGRGVSALAEEDFTVNFDGEKRGGQNRNGIGWERIKAYLGAIPGLRAGDFASPPSFYRSGRWLTISSATGLSLAESPVRRRLWRDFARLAG
jgi:hypothetical protein